MAIKATKKEESVVYTAEVVKAHLVKDGVVAFDMKVNGITIYGCWYREYVNKEGKEGTLISLPSQKGSDGKYYNHCFFPISKELKDNIIAQLEGMI